MKVSIPPIRRERIISIKCDCCGFTATEDDVTEVQEFLSFRDIGGYGALIGDGQTWSIDLCQRCTHDILGKYIVKH